MPLTIFVEERLELGILYGTDGGPAFNTRIIVAASGHEERNVNWSEEQGRWDLGGQMVTRTKLLYILTFFRARRGSAVGFRWKDEADYLLGLQSIGTGDNSTTQFQITQTSDSGFGEPYVRDIKKPVAGTVRVYLDAVEQTETSDWTVDSATGIVTFVYEPGIGEDVRVSCEFDTAVRFDSDQLPKRFEALSPTDGDVAYQLSPLPIVELRV